MRRGVQELRFGLGGASSCLSQTRSDGRLNRTEDS